MPHRTPRGLVRSDRHQLENAVLNLAVNARDAMNGRGKLTITAAGVTLAEGAIGTCHAGDYVALSVADTGCGMNADLLDRVFEPFFTTKPAGKGTGLGLSQVFAFVRQADGQVGLESVVGQGTIVTMYLPRHNAAPVAAPLTPAMPAPPVEQSALDILVVEGRSARAGGDDGRAERTRATARSRATIRSRRRACSRRPGMSTCSSPTC